MNQETWTVCNSCNQRVTGDSVHTCSPQLKQLTDEEILQVMINVYSDTVPPIRGVEFARAILRKAQEK